MLSVKKACYCSICTALCYILPLLFHALSIGTVFSPMHIPILLCGILCGWPYGLFCGVAGPLISSLLSGMPSTLQLVYMIPELAVYGLCAGLLYSRLHTRSAVADLYLALAPAMILGRIAGGAARALFYLSTAQPYSVGLWASAYFVETLPGAVLHLLLIPALVLILTKAGLVPARGANRGVRA